MLLNDVEKHSYAEAAAIVTIANLIDELLDTTSLRRRIVKRLAAQGYDRNGFRHVAMLGATISSRPMRQTPRRQSTARLRAT